MAAPVCLFAYNRPVHLAQTIAHLARNELADQTPLIVYSDAAKDPAALAGVQEVRAICQRITGFASVTVVERDVNWGLARSIIDGVTATVNRFGMVIVLEDDLLTSPYFLRYMNDALAIYRDDERVISAHGYLLPMRGQHPETFFLRGTDCWGWGTWKRGWDFFCESGPELLAQLRQSRREREFDYDNTYDFVRMLEDQIAGRNDSWAIRWYASAFLADKLTLYPGKSLVANIGNDGTGIHSGSTTRFDAALSTRPIQVGGVPVGHDRRMYLAKARFFTSSASIRQRLRSNVMRKLATEGRVARALRGARRTMACVAPVVYGAPKPEVDTGAKLEQATVTPSCPLCHCSSTSTLEVLLGTEINDLYARSLGVQNALKSTRLELRQCPNCDLRFFFPMETGGESLYEQLQDFDWYYLAEKEEYRIALSLLPAKGPVLEVGSGRAVFAGLVGVDRYTGLEFNDKAIQTARMAGVHLIKETVEEHAKRKPNQYDAVVSFQVLEHVSAPAEFVKACVDCLKPGGILVLAVPSRDGFAGAAVNSPLNMPPHHVTHWSEAALRKIGRLHGLEMIALVHEPVASYHRRWARKVWLESVLRQATGLEFRALDSRPGARTLSRLAGILACVPRKARVGIKGHTVVACYRKG